MQKTGQGMMHKLAGGLDYLQKPVIARFPLMITALTNDDDLQHNTDADYIQVLVRPLLLLVSKDKDQRPKTKTLLLAGKLLDFLLAPAPVSSYC